MAEIHVRRIFHRPVEHKSNCLNPANGQEELAALSKKGYQLLKENKNADAKNYFSKILEVDHGNNYALVGLGDALRKLGSFHEAIEFYQRCLDYHPHNNYALFGLADCYKTLNQYNKAIEVWDLYLEHDPKNITILTRVADTYRKLHNFKSSKAMYQQVLDFQEDNSYAIIGLGHLHYDFKEYRDALFYWEKMVEKHGMANADIRVLTSIGNCHRKLKSFENGIIYFDAAIQRESTNFYALFGLGDCFRGLNQPERALECWNTLLEKDPRNKILLTRAGDAYCALKDYENATEYYNRALNIEFDTYAILGLSIIAEINGRIDEAISSLRDLISKDCKNYRPYLELSKCYEKTGDKESAIEALRDFQRLGIRNNIIIKRMESFGIQPVNKP
ncbi:MAG: tetratricopeptide repeat protein [Spirochaetaceae bacterium]|jgi:tetratricopeptide (TPR) repeat protein|nr:tetratricopeptide repeat protein [Spirochaetaceae bacterium]